MDHDEWYEWTLNIIISPGQHFARRKVHESELQKGVCLPLLVCLSGGDLGRRDVWWQLSCFEGSVERCAGHSSLQAWHWSLRIKSPLFFLDSKACCSWSTNVPPIYGDIYIYGLYMVNIMVIIIMICIMLDNGWWFGILFYFPHYNI